MEQLQHLLDEIIDENLKNITISGPRHADGVSKIKIRPVVLKGQVKFQSTRYVGAQVLHANDDAKALAEKILEWMAKDFRQLQARTGTMDVTVLVSKKGKVTIKKSASKMSDSSQESAAPVDPFALVASHNREKTLYFKRRLPGGFPCGSGGHDPGRDCGPFQI